MNESERLSEPIDRLVKGTADTRDRVALDEAHPADIAAVARHLPLTEQVALFRLLSQERAGEVINQLDDATLLELVQVLEEGEVSRILDEMPPEHAADVVEELPSEQAEKILGLMQEDKSEEVQERLDYPEHSAGRLMSPDFVAVRPRHRRAGHRARAEVGFGRAGVRALCRGRSRASRRCRPPPQAPHCTSRHAGDGDPGR